MSDPIEHFRLAIAAAGIDAPDTIYPDGAIHRFSSSGKRGDDCGWYVLHGDGVPAGSFGCWRTGLRSTWCAKSDSAMTDAERKAHRSRVAAINALRAAAEAAKHEATATEAAQRFKNGTPGTQHAYLRSKGVKAHGVKVDADGFLIVPMRDTAGKLWNIERINPADSKDKKGLYGGRRKGLYHSIGKPAGALIVCEGYATGASIHAATGQAVAVAFNAGNLEPVATALRMAHPTLNIIIAADDDHLTDNNPGLTKAASAARAVAGLLAAPVFPASRPDKATDFNDLHLMAGAEAVKACIDAAKMPPTGDTAANNVDSTQANALGDAWPELLPLVSKIEPEPYPVEALPLQLRLAVQEVAGFVKAPLPLIAVSALAALSLVAQAHHDVERADKLTGPCSVFLLAIADSGERKTTCDGFFTKSIRDFEAAAQEAAKPDLDAYRCDAEIWEAQRAGMKEKIKALAKEGKPSAAQENELRRLGELEPKPPLVPRLIYGDATPEALTWGLAKKWPSAAVISSEAGSVFGGHGMGRDSVMRNLATLNQLWDGAVLPVERRSTESFTVRGARLTIALQVQEATLQAFFDGTKGLARGTGFLARFLVAWPQSTQGQRPFSEAPPNWPALAAFNSRLTAVLSRPAPIDADGALSPAMLNLSPAAKAAWISFHDQIEAMLSTGGELFDVRDVASKTADNAARLAALFHVFEGGIGPIGFDSMESGACIAAWHLNESRRFFGALAMPAELANQARLEGWLLDWCRREKTDTVPTREVQRCGPGGLRDKAACAAAVKALAELGRARMVQDGRKRLIQINPVLLYGGAS